VIIGTTHARRGANPLRAEEYNLLRSSCRAVAKKRPGLQRRQGEAADENANSIKQELDGFLGEIWKDRERVYASSNDILQPLVLLFDVALLQVCDMSYFGYKYAGGRARLIWPKSPLPKKPSPDNIFYVLASNLAHSMQAFRILILYGFESQARATFRGVVETVDLMIMVSRLSP
jgi:hypothetical protein